MSTHCQVIHHFELLHYATVITIHRAAAGVARKNLKILLQYNMRPLCARSLGAAIVEGLPESEKEKRFGTLKIQCSTLILFTANIVCYFGYRFKYGTGTCIIVFVIR
jgi:hypothetical protein